MMENTALTVTNGTRGTVVRGARPCAKRASPPHATETCRVTQDARFQVRASTEDE